jgi:acyl-coenzyme A thioesterase PaaI-like protein
VSKAEQIPSEEGKATETGPEAIERVFMALHPKVRIDGCEGWALFHPEVEHRGNPGWLHGGLAATLLDHVSARVANSALGGPAVTGKLEVRYVRPVPLSGGPFRVVASYEPPKPGRTLRYLVRIEAAIVDEAGNLVEASSMFVPRPEFQGERPDETGG